VVLVVSVTAAVGSLLACIGCICACVLRVYCKSVKGADKKFNDIATLQDNVIKAHSNRTARSEPAEDCEAPSTPPRASPSSATTPSPGPDASPAGAAAIAPLAANHKYGQRIERARLGNNLARGPLQSLPPVKPGASNVVVLAGSDKIVKVPAKATSSTREPASEESKPQAASSSTAAEAPSKDGAAVSEPEPVAELDARGSLLQAMQEEKARVEEELASLRSKTEVAPMLAEEMELADVPLPAVPPRPTKAPLPALQPQRKRPPPLPQTSPAAEWPAATEPKLPSPDASIQITSLKSKVTASRLAPLAPPSLPANTSPTLAAPAWRAAPATPLGGIP
tara:strand:+ start:185 stop:1198 length:1014 start_codon:yes stop_codon:yes gene_type:complete